MDILDIIERYENHPPIDLMSLAEKLGIQIDFSHDLGQDIAGKITRQHNGKFLISVNSNNTAKRQRFTIAHEIAHYALHKDEIGDRGVIDNSLFRSNLSNHREQQANRLAAQMLMPAKLVRIEWEKGNRDLSYLSQHFGVSQQAAEVRLDWLGLTETEDDWD